MTELEIIKNLGLSVNEIKVYLSLFGKGHFSATEISNTSGVSRTIIYRVLNSLMEKGLCSLLPGKVKKYKVSRPDVSFSQLINDKKKCIEEANNLMADLNRRYLKNSSNDTSLDYIEILKDPSLINAHYIKLLSRTEHEILGFVKGPTVGLKAKSVDQQASEAIKLHREKGVIHKSIFDLNLINQKQTENASESCFEFASRVKSQGNRQLRIHKNLPLKATIFDSRFVMLVLPDPVTKEFAITTLIFDHKQLASALKKLFYFLWDESQIWEDFLRDKEALVCNQTTC